ncbi:MAG: hypothetical protein JXB62_21020 [Pirellulales bacterium]|nr:hypothetical protein [Pirellulales bacterium]
MEAASVGAIGQQGQQDPTGHDAFRDVALSDFIDLMVAELQNQDPLNPMDNAEILQQMSQIRSIESNDRLTETLESVFLAQNVSTAGSMLGKWMANLSEDGSVGLFGRIDRVSVEGGVPMLHVGDETVNLKNAGKMQLFSDAAGQEFDEYMQMVGKTVEVVPDGNEQVPSQTVTGLVYQVSFTNGAPKLHIGNRTADLSDVVRVLASGNEDT